MSSYCQILSVQYHMFANKLLVPHTSLGHGLSMLVPAKFCKALYAGKEDYTMSKRMQDMQGKLHI